MSSKRNHLVRLTTAAMLLALAFLLPFLTGQIPEVGNMLCPMHLPVLLCGFFCGPLLGAVVGATAPLLRSLSLGMPPLFPVATAMAFELLTYGALSGLLYRLLPKKRWSVYAALGGAMLGGRLVWGIVSAILYGIIDSPFGFGIFFTQAFLNAIPGILLQIVLIPLLVLTLEKNYTKLLRG